MKIVDYFKDRARAAYDSLDTLVDQQFAGRDRRRTLEGIQARFEQMQADGQIDAAEKDELVAQFRSAGLAPEALESLFDELATDGTIGAHDNPFSKLVGDALDDAQDATSDNEALLNLQIQLLMGEGTNSEEAAARVLATQHQAYMQVISKIGQA